MIDNKQISGKYFTMLMHDKDIKQKVEDATELLYSLVINKDVYETHLRYDISTAKKIAFCLRSMGYNVEEYRHGKLHVKIIPI